MIMKKYITLLVVVLFLTSGHTAAQGKNDVKTALKSIIELCKAKKFDEAAKSVAFCVNEKTGEYKATDLSNKEQHNTSSRLVKRIGALASVSDSFEIGNSSPKKINGTDMTETEVNFVSGSQSIKSLFRFVKINDEFLLAEVE